MTVIDLNADVGEGTAPAADEHRLVESMTSVSISCGAHAGTTEDIRAAAQGAVAAGVVIGAHPSYPDRPGFGRRELDMSSEALSRSLAEQIAALDAVVRDVGGAVRYLKPHGALYHRTSTDPETARLVAHVALANGIAVLLLAAGAPAAAAARAAGVEVVAEGFVDRAYEPDGTLVPRDRPGAVIADEAAAIDQALALAAGGRAPLPGGGWVAVAASSLCFHGDTPGAGRSAMAVRRALEEAGIRLSSFVS